ncbi:11706_t:CDS:2 [Scutellospora calospora]|uniref:11706_t:CDS:1 n=1 Tax=Scutellospora calospora TaxID=85575 RepID=A0ACA9M7A3_9GLOM|nr:11706_t:CDS:2 [Scutellospora calospora]
MSKLRPKPRPSTTSSEAQKLFSAYLQQVNENDLSITSFIRFCSQKKSITFKDQDPLLDVYLRSFEFLNKPTHCKLSVELQKNENLASMNNIVRTYCSGAWICQLMVLALEFMRIWQKDIVEVEYLEQWLNILKDKANNKENELCELKMYSLHDTPQSSMPQKPG